MRQQINLHQPVFRGERKTLSATTVAATLGLSAVALTAFSLYAAHMVGQLQAQVTELTEQQQNQQAQLLNVGEVLAHQGRRSDIEARVKALKATLSERSQALKVLQSGAAGQTSGFAARMEALARRHVNGLWIDGLAMSGTQGTMSISGGSVDADIVPVYLRSLSGEAALSGTRFDDFVIERPDKSAGVRFRAGNKSLPLRQPPAT